MYNLIKAEIKKIVKSKIFFVNITLAALFVMGRSINYRYELHINMMKNGTANVEFINLIIGMFKDNTILIPALWFILFYSIGELKYNYDSFLISKGVSRKNIFLSRTFACWLGIVMIIIVSVLIQFLNAVLYIGQICNVVIDIHSTIDYLLVQCILYLGLSCIIFSVCFSIKNGKLCFIITHFIILILNLYFGKLSYALDLHPTLNHYWIVGLSKELTLQLIYEKPIFLILLSMLYSIVFLIIGVKIYNKTDLVKGGI